MSINKRIQWKVVPILTFLLVILITVGIFLCRDRVTEFGNYGYLGVFLVSFTSSATIILPIPSMLLLFAFGAILNPFLVGLIASTGGTIGEVIGFLLGRSGRKLTADDKMYERADKWIHRFGAITVFVFALVPPLPVDIVGVAAGVLRLPMWKFLLPCFAGKIILYTGMALAGAWGCDIVLRYFT